MKTVEDTRQGKHYRPLRFPLDLSVIQQRMAANGSTVQGPQFVAVYEALAKKAPSPPPPFCLFFVLVDHQ